MRALFFIAVSVCALLGIAHIGFTFFNYDHWSRGAVWFAGTGVALLLIATLNWASWGVRHPSAGVRRVVLGADVLMTIFGFAAVRAIPEPQAYVLLATFVLMAWTGFALERRPDKAWQHR